MVCSPLWYKQIRRDELVLVVASNTRNREPANEMSGDDEMTTANSLVDESTAMMPDHADFEGPNPGSAADQDQIVGRSTTVEAEPKRDSWKIVAAGAVVPLGLSCAAAVATSVTQYEKVAMTAWIAVAVVGTASVISTAIAAQGRIRSVRRGHHQK